MAECSRCGGNCDTYVRHTAPGQARSNRLHVLQPMTDRRNNAADISSKRGSQDALVGLGAMLVGVVLLHAAEGSAVDPVPRR